MLLIFLFFSLWNRRINFIREKREKTETREWVRARYPLKMWVYMEERAHRWPLDVSKLFNLCLFF